MNDEYKKMLERFEQICQNAKKELCGKEEKELEKRFIEKINKELTINGYDEIEYWLASVEALDNNAVNDILEENKRLNNIINELNNAYCKVITKCEEMINSRFYMNDIAIKKYADEIKDICRYYVGKAKELKGADK